MRTLVTPPATEPVPLVDAKLFLRVDAAEEDALITMLVASARRRAEFLTGRFLITQDWKLTLDGFPFECLDPRMSPIQQVVSVTYYDKNNALQTLAGTKLIQDQLCPLLYPPDSGWPQTYGRPDAVSITLRLGYGDAAANVPESIRQWILIRLGSAYENRQGMVTAQQELPRSYLDGLLDEQSVTRV